MSKHIDTSKFNAMCRELARMVPGATLERVVDHEASKVIEKALSGTPAASVAKIRSNAENRKFGAHRTGYQPRRPFRGRVVKGKKIYNYAHRYPDPLWAEIATQRKASIKRKIAARGLAKRSWVELARTFGFEIGAPGYVKKALPSTGRTYPGNVRSGRTRLGARYGLHVVNAQPTVNLPSVGGKRALLKAINGRVSFYRRNLKHGVFKAAADIAKKYPGIRTNTNG